VQEALTNVHKHARGAATTVDIRGNEATGVSVSVANRRPVAAGSLLPGSGAGLVGLSERLRLLGGRLRSGPDVDGGWRLEAWLPWAPTAEAASPAALDERSPA
jgi:signal transduction histidine kinase